MKIQRFNESSFVDDQEATDSGDIYEEFEDSDQLALYFYNAGGWVVNVILFNNWDDLGNYVINYVNAYILDIYDNDIDNMKNDFKDADNLVYDSNGFPCFTTWDEAYKWINDIENSTTIGFQECKKAKNIEIEERVKLAMRISKYNL